MCKSCRKATTTAAHRKQRLAVYELTPQEYQELLTAQGGVCAMCGAARKYNLAVDHDHAMERTHGSRISVRGLLCKRCNKLLAYAADKVDLLLAAVDYLRIPPARKVLGTSPD